MSTTGKRSADSVDARPAKRVAIDYQQPAHEDFYLFIMSAIFWDINFACYFPKIIQGSPESVDWKMFEDITARTMNFIEATLSPAQQELFNGPEKISARLLRTLDCLGWKIFAICAHSEAFQDAIETLDETDYTNLLSLITHEQRSIEIFARSRDLDWRGPLLSKAGDEWPGLREALAPEINLATGHPHHIVQTEDGGLRQPIYPWEDGTLQLNIRGNFSPADFRREYVAQRRHQSSSACIICGTKTCRCDPMYIAGDFVELREYPGKGAGVRSLANFPPGVFIGEFNGMLCESVPAFDPYSMKFAVADDTERGRARIDRELAQNSPFKTAPMVSPERFGSWTRYANHQCDEYAACPRAVWVGDRAQIACQTTRNVSVFEELTITYGSAYWTPPRVCMCGDEKCCSNGYYSSSSSD